MRAPKIQPQTADHEFFLTTSKAWQAMYHACREAKKSIEIEQYMLRPDILGMRFIKLFQKKAKQGLKVRLLVDKIGSYELYYSSAVLRELKESGVEIHFYNPIGFINLLAPSTWFPRDHIKSMLIDGEVAYIGGVCFDSRMRTWRDTQVRFTGSEVETVKRDMEHTWKRAEKDESRARIFYPDRKKPLSYTSSTPLFRRNIIYKLLLEEIRSAKKEICIATPYFIPPRRFMRYLHRAVRRGVKVSIIVTKKSDVSLADYVAQSYFRWMCRRGMRVFYYGKTTLHAKYLTIDDCWGTIGSTNMDYLSLLHNREANLVVNDQAIVKELRGHFESDLKDSEEYTKSDWQSRPISHKVLGFIFRPLRRFM